MSLFTLSNTSSVARSNVYTPPRVRFSGPFDAVATRAISYPGDFARQDAFQRNVAINQNAAGLPINATQSPIPVLPPRPASMPPLRETDAIRRFVIVGDAGVGHQPKFYEQDRHMFAQDAVAAAMTREFIKKPYAAILTTGDNVYPNGEVELFNEDIRRPYEQLFKQGVQYYPTLGNHDVMKGHHGTDQMNFSHEPRYYQKHLGNVDIFAIDNTLLYPQYAAPSQHGATYGPDAIKQARKMGQEQLQWLDQALASSTARYKVVYGHYPLHSQSELTEPAGMLETLRQTLNPILQRNGVDAYVAGHNHTYERKDSSDGSMTEIVTGAGGRILKPKEIAKMGAGQVPLMKVFIPKRHFMIFEETPTGLTFKAIDERDQVLDQGLIKPKA